MVQKASSTIKFRQAWTFPEALEKRIAKKVENLGGLWLHAPVGISKITKGMFESNPNVTMLTVDLDDTVKPDIVCDIFKLTENPQIQEIMKKHGGFDGVISDPVWHRMVETKIKCKVCQYENRKIIKNRIGLAYHQRRHEAYQVRDVLKPGGIWLFNGLWIPQVKGLKLMEPLEVLDQKFTSFRNVSLLVTMKKINNLL